MKDMTTPVTHADLDTVVGAILEAIKQLGRDLRAEMATMRNELRGDMNALRGELRGDMNAMEGRLMVELARASNANAEDLRTRINVVDERYRDLPARVTRLEAVRRRKR